MFALCKEEFFETYNIQKWNSACIYSEGVTFDRPQAVFSTELCETSAMSWV